MDTSTKEKLLEANEDIKIQKDNLFYTEKSVRDGFVKENINLLELMSSKEYDIKINDNELTQKHLFTLSLSSYIVDFSKYGFDSCCVLTVNDKMQSIIQKTQKVA